MMIRIILACLSVLPLAWGQRDFFEMEPTKYSEAVATDPMAMLAAAWKSGKKPLPDKSDPLEVLKVVLKELEVPIESQGLVYSKTSKQNNLITPQNPRSVFFGDNAYVGYVPGGDIEVAAMDPVLGPVFYLLHVNQVGEGEWVMRANSCLQCHGTSRTELVPGLLVRSVFVQEDGHPLLGAGTFLTTHASPLKARWGGWFVTGMHGEARHMGNTIAVELDDGGVEFDFENGANWTSLEGKVNTSKYLAKTSNIVALMVLEHQCKMDNLLNKASLEYRRLVYLQKAINPETDIKADGMAARAAKDLVEQIVRYMLFTDEMDLGDGVEGDGAFSAAFEARGPMNEGGDSLRELRLYGRLFKNRCSYMIYSTAFETMPDAVRDLVLTRIWEVMSGEDESEEFSDLGKSEKRRILSIVKETVPRLPGCWE
ncbi:MAG: hypothetical protein OSA48_04595 [Akkermansiaceae bacterium]|nr:hypothetical protein [Akkermansiaceae bacterium]